MHPLRNPRRIALSVLLFGLLSGGGLIGVAMATDDGEPVPVPFTFALPREGDQGVYQVRSDADAWEFGRIERGEGQITFEHRGRSVVHDGAGMPRVVDEVAFDDDRYDDRDFWGAPGHTAALLDARAGQVIAVIDEWNQEEEEDEEDVGRARVVRFLDEEHFYRDDLPCGLLSALQGRTLLAGARVAGQDCNGHRLPQDATAHFQVDAVGQDGNASQVSLWQQRTGQAPERVADLLFGADMAYPLEVHLFDRDVWIGTLELMGFQAGQQSVAPVDSFELPAPVHVVMAPRTDWMFDETGIDHPFPLSEAVTYAREDETQDLAAWLASRPQAYIVDVSYWDYEGDSKRIEWRVTFREDQDIYHLHIGKRFPADAAPDPVQDLLGDINQDPVEPHYYFTASTREVDYYGTWHPAPEMLPTVASMWSVYEAWARPEMPANMWEVTIIGQDEGNRVLIDAGRFRDFTAGRDDATTYSRDWSFINVDVATGRADQFSDRGYDRPTMATSVSGSFSPQSYAAIEVPDFAPFTAKQAASVGGGAAILALLYYLFPAGKSFAFGLFSRVRKDDALDHPTRQQIADYICAHPGCHHQALLRALNLARGTGQHHLGKLEETGHVVSVNSGGFKCYFLRGQQDRRTMAAYGVVKSQVAQGIVQRLQTGTASTGQLSKALGVKPATISYHVKRLRDAGLVTHAPGGHVATPAAAAI